MLFKFARRAVFFESFVPEGGNFIAFNFDLALLTTSEFLPLVLNSK